MTEDTRRWCGNDDPHGAHEWPGSIVGRWWECAGRSGSYRLSTDDVPTCGDPHHPCSCGCMAGHIGRHYCACGYHWRPVTGGSEPNPPQATDGNAPAGES